MSFSSLCVVGAVSLYSIYYLPMGGGNWSTRITPTCRLGFVCLLSRVRLFVTPRIVARQSPLTMGFFQARILERVAMPSSRGPSRPRDRTHISYVSCFGRQVLYHGASREYMVQKSRG